MDEIIAEFLIDSHEEVEQLDQNLVLLGDTRDTAVLNQVFRSLQTLRGTCGFLAFWHLERVAHGGEKLVGVVRQEQLDWSPEVADALLATVDKIRQILGTIERTEAEGEPDTQDLVDRLAALDDQHSSPATVATAPPTPPSPPASATMPTAAPTPATSPFVDAAAHLVDPLAELDWAADDVAAIPSPAPTPEAAAPGQSSAVADLEPEAPAAEPSDPALAESVASGAPTADEPLGHPFALPAAHPAVFPLPTAEPAPVEPAPATEPGGFEPAPSAEAAPVEPPAVPAGETGLVAEAAPVEPALVAGPEPIGREQSEGTEAASSSPEVASEASSPGRIGDLLVDSGSAERTDVEIAAAEQALGDERPIGRILVDDGRTNEAAVETAARAQRTRVPEPTIGVDVALLDRLLDLVGELVHSRNQIVHLVDEGHDRDLAASAHRLDRVTSELQDGIMRTRMQPIAHEWNKLPRLVRDRSNRLGKQVRIDMVGGETELDRTVIEAIAGPLLHLVRNTVDHAIESPVDRMMAGKDPEGVLGLRAAHEGGQITIEITDDGHGIAAGPILAAAVERGFIEPEVATRLTEKQAVQLIFEPGFSTAGRVGDGTPRGAGMDVVKAGVEGIGGTVELQTEPGVGTTITLRIPLTMAIIPALTVTVGDARYAIPQANVSDLVRLDGHGAGGRIEELHGTPVYRLRGRLLPIVDLGRELGGDECDGDVTNIVVLDADGRHFGLVVDTIEDAEEIVAKPLGRLLEDAHLFCGATIMRDGRIALVLDVLGLADSAHVLSESGEIELDDEAGSGSRAVEDRTLLLVGLDDRQQVAVPLAGVERLEEFPIEVIEWSEGRPVVQYRQQIMPLVDLGAALGGGSGLFDDVTHVSVIVCSRDGQTIGVAVRRILDVVAHADGLETIVDGTERVVVNGLITDVVDLAAAISSVRPSIHGGADDQGLADHGQPGGTRTDLSAQSRPVGV